MRYLRALSCGAALVLALLSTIRYRHKRLSPRQADGYTDTGGRSIPRATSRIRAEATPTPSTWPRPCDADADGHRAPCAEDDFENALAGLEISRDRPGGNGRPHRRIEVVPGDPRTVYVATAAGGILKSTNGGTSWNFVFDKESVSSIGDIAISPIEPVDHLGRHRRGEQPPELVVGQRYLQVDGRAARRGSTWASTSTMHIARIVVHPHESEHGLRRGRGQPLGAERRTAASIKRPTAARRGSRS